MTWIRCVPAALLLMLPAACVSGPKLDEAGLRWTACGDDQNWAVAGASAPRRAHLTVECADLRVPLAYDDPRTVSLDVAVVRVRDDRAARPHRVAHPEPGRTRGVGSRLPPGLGELVPR